MRLFIALALLFPAATLAGLTGSLLFGLLAWFGGYRLLT